MAALLVTPLAAMFAAWLLVSFATPETTPIYEASISLTFAGELDLPDSTAPPVTPVEVVGDASEFVGQPVTLARTDLISPFTTEISGNRRTITFLARDIVRDDAASFALYAARRFSERQGETLISSTPGSVRVAGEREMAGVGAGSPLAVGLIVLGFAVLAVAGSTQSVRRALPAMLHILLR